MKVNKPLFFHPIFGGSSAFLIQAQPTKENILINNSHTHSSPSSPLSDVWQKDEDEIKVYGVYFSASFINPFRPRRPQLNLLGLFGLLSFALTHVVTESVSLVIYWIRLFMAERRETSCPVPKRPNGFSSF